MSKQVIGGVELPEQTNAILILFDDSFKNVKVEFSPYLWDMLKALGEQEIVFTKTIEKHKLEIAVGMEEQ